MDSPRPADEPSAVADPARLQALRDTGLLDGPADPLFDRLTALAARLLQAPTALVSLIDCDRQFFVSAFGLAEPWSSRRQTPLSHSFCQHLIGDAPVLEVLEVLDARVDGRVKDNRAVPELGFVAYLGVPLRGPGGARLGALCAIDSQPRKWSPEQLAALRELSALVEAVIHERVARQSLVAALATSERTLQERTAWLESVLEAMDDAVVVMDRDARIILANEVGRQIVGAWPNAAAWPPGTGFFMADQQTPYPLALLPAAQALRGTRVRQLELFLRSPTAPAAAQGVWQSINASPLRDAKGDISGAVVVSRDTTVLREASLEILKNNRDRGLLHQVAAAANQWADLNRVLREALAAITESTGWPLAHVSLRGGDGVEPSEIWVGPQVASYQPLIDATLAIPLEERSPIADRVRQTGRTRVVSPLSAEAAPARLPFLKAAGLEAGVFLPIKANGETIAVIELFLHGGIPTPEPDFVSILEDAASTLGRVFERTQARAALERHSDQLQALSLIDELTSLNNRRGFLTLAEQQRRAGQRARIYHHLIFLDLDGMKTINDRLGHAEGDLALRDTAQLLRSVFRESDILARLGGDEFVVFAASGTVDGDRPILARMREALRQFNEAGTRPFKLELSMGSTPCDPEHPRSIEELLQIADGLMYEQKRLRKAQAKEARG